MHAHRRAELKLEDEPAAGPHMEVTQGREEIKDEEVCNLGRWMEKERLRLDHLKSEGVRVLEH